MTQKRVSSVAAFGMLLRESNNIGNYSYDDVLELAKSARGTDENGYRIEFINMIQMGRTIAVK